MKIQLIVQDMVTCKYIPLNIINVIANALTFINPVYANMIKRGWVNNAVPAKLKYFDMEKQIIYIPKGYLLYLMKILRNVGLEYSLKYETPVFPTLKLKFTGIPRPYQKKAIHKMTEYSLGILEAKTGSGKTFIALGIIAVRKCPTLIIVHNKELLYQWKAAIKQFLNYDCGLIGDGKYDIKPITVGIVNSVSANINKLRKRFNFLVGDEIHRVCSNNWVNIFSNIQCRYQLGLSASPYRRDGLTNLVYYMCGPIIHTIDSKELESTGAVLKPEIRKVFTEFNYKFRNDYSDMINKLCTDIIRNKRITTTVLNDIKQYNEQILVISDRVSHCELIKNALAEAGIKTETLSGRLSRIKRAQILEDMKSSKIQVLCSTVQLIGEGTDIPSLSSLFITTPIRFKGRTIQACGRILRPTGNIKPRIYDFADMNIHVLKSSSEARECTYRSEGWI